MLTGAQKVTLRKDFAKTIRHYAEGSVAHRLWKRLHPQQKYSVYETFEYDDRHGFDKTKFLRALSKDERKIYQRDLVLSMEMALKGAEVIVLLSKEQLPSCAAVRTATEQQEAETDQFMDALQDFISDGMNP